jgi:hypothetical protein
MNQTHLLIAGALVLGFLFGRAGVKAGSTGATAHNDANAAQDWWTYAGSWA